MARNYTTTAVVDLRVNAKQAAGMVAKLKKEAEDLKKQFDKAEKAGDKIQMKALRKAMEENRRNLRLFETATAQAADTLSRLDKATPKELNKTLRQLKNQLNNIPRGSQTWKEHIEKIRQVKEEIASINREMRETGSFWENTKGFVSKYVTGLSTIFGWLSDITAKLEEFVKDYTGMQQEMANVQKFTGMSEEDVTRLNDAFKNLDTRTSRENLNLLAQEAGRLGKSSVEDVLGFVRASDKINVALDDLGEGATLTLSKLTSIFGDEERLGTEKALLSVGSVINELSQNCSASSSYIADFASRLGGVGAQAGMTVQQIMAFGSVLDSQGQALEVSATALSQLIVKLYQDPAKYVKVAGLDVKEFSELLKKDANEAIIQFLEALSKAGKMDVLSVMFKDMGEKGTGMVNTLTTLAGSIGMVKNQQLVANEAFEEAVSIDKEFEVQNNTVMAGYEKSKKALKEITIELGEKLAPALSLVYSSTTVLMNVLSNIINFFYKNKTAVMAATTAIAAYQVAINFASIKTAILTARTATMNKVYAVTRGLAKAMTLIFAGLHNAINYFTNGLQVNYVMQQRWQKAVKAMNFSNWAALILTVAAAVVVLTKKFFNARSEAEKMREEFAKIEREANEAAASEIKVLEKLYEKTQDQNLAQEERIKAINKLRQMYPDYFKDISNEAFLAGQAAEAYDKLKKSILETAKARGREDMIARYEQEIQELQDKYDKEAEFWIKEKMKARANADFNLNNRMSFQDDPSYNYADKQLNILNKRYLDPISEKRKKQNELADLNAGFKLNNPDVEASTPSFTGYTHVETEKERRKREAEARKAQAEARRNEVKARKEFKDALKQIQGDRDKAEAEAKVSRSIGAIDYLEYIEQMRKAEIEYFNSSLKLYEDHNLQEDADYKALLEKKADADERYRSQKLVLDKEATEREYKVKEQEEKARYNALRNTSLQDEMEHSLNLYSLQIQKLIDLRSLYEKGSKEWHDYDLKLKEASAAEQEKRQKMFVAKAAEFQKEFDKLTVAEKYKLEREALKTLSDMKYISEKEYREWLEKLNKKEKKERREEKDELPGRPSGGAMENAEMAKAKFEAQKSLLDDALSKGIIDQEEYSKRLTNIKNEYHEALVSPLKEAKSEWVSMVATMVDSWIDFADALKGGKDPFEAVQKGLEATVAVMSAVMSQITEFTKAEMQIQTAAIEKRYDREIAFAEGNSYLTKRLEKQKQDEIAKIKEDAANKEFSMQVIMAIAQTATNALNAYGAGLKVGGMAGLILAPIAAATAVAAGMVQVASIKKQKEAAAATGYSKGGFTKPGEVDEPAGVVHAGEWVASQKLVKSPVARPIIDMLEYAQRTNRIGSLSMEDVSRSISAPMRIASMARESAVVQVPASAAASGSKAGEGLSKGDLVASINRLNSRLEEPIVAVSSVTGEFGSKRAEEKYNRMMRNKSPRKRS